jgi:tetratricopeptide (TPR) repeat protein
MVGVMPALAQSGGPTSTQTEPDRAAAYYHYSLGHLYAELAGAYGNKGDFLNKAIENYKLAMKADPGASFLSEELSDLYIQAGRLREAVVEAEDALKKDPNDVNARKILARIYTRLIGDSQQKGINQDMLRRAIEQYKKIGEVEPDDVDNWIMLGRLYKVQQNSVEAEKAYKKALEVEPDNEDALIGLAMVYADLGDNQRASEVLKKVVDKRPTLRTLTALASSYEQLKEYDLAAQTYRRALEISPRSDIKRALAQTLLLAEKTDEALKVYKELIQEDPKDFQSQLRLSQIYRQQGQFGKAREALDQAKELVPDNLEIRYNEVSLLEAEGKIPEAISALNEILTSTEQKTYNSAERANRAVFLERLGLLYRSNEQYGEAVRVFRQLLELDPSLGARASAQISDTYRQAKDFVKAEQESEAAYKKYPDDRMVAIVRATVLADTGKGDQAVTIVRKLLKSSNDRETWLALAQIYDKTKDYAELGKAIDQAEKLSESDDEKVGVYFMRGAMYEKQKKYDEAEAEFRNVLKLDPKNASALNYLGYMLADRNVRLTEAHEMITKALEYEPNNGAYLDSLGWVLYRMDRLQEAEDYLLRAVQKVSHDPIVREHLGDVYFRQGKLKDAIAQWEISLKEWSTSPASEKDPEAVAKIQKKLESAKVRLAKEASAPVTPKQP